LLIINKVEVIAAKQITRDHSKRCYTETMKLLRIIIVAIILAGLGLFLLARQAESSFVLKIPFLEKTLQIDTTKINQLSENAPEELKTITERGQVVGEHVQNVLGSSVKVSDSAPPIHERALEYGRYLYCQEVVKEYEAK